MKKKEIKKTKLKPRRKAEVKENQSGVILERMEHKFDLLSEGFLGLDKDIKGLDKKFDDLNKKVDDNHRETNDNFKTLFKFRNETNDNFKVNFEYLSKIDDKIQWIESEITDLKNILKNKASLDRVMRVEKELIFVKKELALCRRQ